MTKYNIVDINKAELGSRLYFFDANIWLFILDRQLEPDPRQQPYIDFWERLTHPDRGVNKVVVANTLLISEVFNRFLRMKFESYKKEQIQYHRKPASEVNQLDFKKDYRNTIDYQENLIAFTSEFTAYSYYIEIVNDRAEELDVMELLEEISPKMDFNDLLYYKFCKLNDYPIVTDDGDFKFKEIPILTRNRNLLDLKN